MSTSGVQSKNRPIIQGRGLTSPGVIALYLFGLLLIQIIENFISGEPGRITGITLLALFIIAIKLGRPSALFTAVVTPPLALSATLILATLVSKGFALTTLLVSLVSSLARLAPWLLLTAIVSWSYFFIAQRKVIKPSLPPSDPSSTQEA